MDEALERVLEMVRSGAECIARAPTSGGVGIRYATDAGGRGGYCASLAGALGRGYQVLLEPGRQSPEPQAFSHAHRYLRSTRKGSRWWTLDERDDPYPSSTSMDRLVPVRARDTASARLRRGAGMRSPTF